jgi:plastocyanin
MKTRVFFVVLTIFTGALYLMGFTFEFGEKTGEIKMNHAIVGIGAFEGIKPKPTILAAKVGTTVIWVNYANRPVEILFLDKRVVLACGSPVNFFVGKDDAYESAKIQFGGTASLCFTEKGEYPYLVKYSSTFYSEKGIRGMYRGSIVID